MVFDLLAERGDVHGVEGELVMGEEILHRIIQFASGESKTKAELLAQNDFIPWKRGVSL